MIHADTYNHHFNIIIYRPLTLFHKLKFVTTSG